jgi:hypothetical protein
MRSEPSVAAKNATTGAKSSFWDLPAFLCMVLLIWLATALLMAVAASTVLALAKISTGFGAALVEYDPDGLSIVAVSLLPLGLGWWLYTKSLRWIASRLELGIPRHILGIPILGEFRFVAELVRHTSRRW